MSDPGPIPDGRQVDIHKAAGILIKDRRVLVARTHGKPFFVQPGGKLEPGETETDAVIRELSEEVQIAVDPKHLVPLGTFYALAAGQEDKWLRLDAFLVQAWEGEPTAANEIAELRWISSSDAGTIELASIMQHDIIPLLISRDLID